MDANTVTFPHTIKVCVDCLMVLANGIESKSEQTAAEGIERIWGDTQITPGAGTQDCGHDLNDPLQDRKHIDYCETLGFSRSWCEGCGSELGGDRHAATVWLVAESVAP